MNTSRVFLSCILVATIGCGVETVDTPHAAETSAAVKTSDPQLQGNGSYIVEGVEYESVSAFHESDAFRDSNKRCGSLEPTLIAEFAPTDCSFSMTSIENDYMPTQVYRIPVVFHVIRRSNGTGEIADELILSQLDVLNEDFRALTGSLGEAGNDSMIEFYLATTDPDGNPTTGINRHTNNGYYTDPGPGAFNDMKQDLNWDTSRYFNIYTNDGSGGGTLGYATFPQQDAETYLDGVVLNWQFVGRNTPTGGNYNLGRTGTHEVGHYLGLFHTFQGGCGFGGPYTSGDLIADTNAQNSPTFSCPSSAPSSCSSPDPYENYMDYSDDICMYRFTQEQINRMRCSMIHYRPNLYVVGGDDQPMANFSYTENGLTVDFMDQSSDPNGSITAWDWDFGDGNTSNAQDPTHTFNTSAVYSVTLTVTNEAGDMAMFSLDIEVGERPFAEFTYTTNSLQVTFNDISSDADSAIATWNWNFGDGNTSIEQNPVHTYANPGTYTVTLDVTDEGGLPGSAFADVTVDFAPMVNFDAVIDELVVTFTDRTTDAVGTPVNWSWNFGDGNTSAEQNPVHTYTIGGTYNVSLSVTNNNSATGTAVQTLMVNALPIAAFDHSVDNLMVTFTNQSSDPDGSIASYAWNFGDGTTSTEASPVHEYAEKGTYAVTLVVTDSLGDTAMATDDVEAGSSGCGCEVGRASGSGAPTWPAAALLFGIGLMIIRRRASAAA